MSSLDYDASAIPSIAHHPLSSISSSFFVDCFASFACILCILHPVLGYTHAFLGLDRSRFRSASHIRIHPRLPGTQTQSGEYRSKTSFRYLQGKKTVVVPLLVVGIFYSVFSLLLGLFLSALSFEAWSPNHRFDSSKTRRDERDGQNG